MFAHYRDLCSPRTLIVSAAVVASIVITTAYSASLITWQTNVLSPETPSGVAVTPERTEYYPAQFAPATGGHNGEIATF
jgi:hypothetical protein